MAGEIDIFMVTYNRPDYTRLSLTRLLETCDESMRVWLWHNGDHAETLDVVHSLADHPRVHQFHHSAENKKLREPTNWFWSSAKGAYLCKVDDDCLMPPGWADVLRRAHADVPEFGIIGCWRFAEEDFIAEIAQQKIAHFPGGHQLLRNCWVEGSGYLMKRRCFDELGPMRTKESFTRYCVRVASAGWINGWYYPFLRQEHMDDPRAPHSLLHADEDMARYLPLSAQATGVKTLKQWKAQLRRSALIVQRASVNPGHHQGLRRMLQLATDHVLESCGMRGHW